MRPPTPLIIRILACICPFFLTAHKAPAQSPLVPLLHYEPAIVRLEGIVHSQKSPGPPNYDQTSSTETWYYLLLKQPVSVAPNRGDQINSKAEAGVKKIQLILSSREAHTLLGKRVIIDGTLFHAHTGHHHTQIVLQPSALFVQIGS